MIAIFLLACATHDPHAALRTSLAEVDQAPLADGWAPEATVLLDGSRLARTLTELARQELSHVPETLTPSVPLDVDVQIRPRVTLESLSVAATDACASCLLVSQRLSGDTAVRLENDTGAMERTLAWTAELQAIVALEVAREPSGDRVLRLAATQPDAWTVDLTLGAVPVPIAVTAGRYLQDSLRGALARPLPTVPVARIQRDGPVRVRGLRVSPSGDDLRVDLVFVAPPGGAVAEIAPRGDWTAVVPAATLLSVAQAAAAQLGTVDGVAVEPTALTLADDRFTLGVTGWKGRRRVELEIVGTVRVEHDQVALEADADLAGSSRHDPVLLLVRGRLLAAVGESLAAAVPATVEEGGLAVTIEGLEARDDTLVIWGAAASTP